MRVLVSGSNGFVGTALVARLRAEGHEVHRLVRSQPGTGEVGIDLGARRIDASRLPGGSLEGLDAVVNLAGEPITPARWGASKRERIRSSRVETTAILARTLATLASPPEVLVSGSAIGYYGDRGDELLAEGCRPGTGFLPEVCSAWEHATSPAAARGIRVVKVRTGIVLGPGGGLLGRLLALFRAGLGGRLGSGWQWTSWISLEDEVRVLIHAATRGDLDGVLNATSPEPVRNKELTATLAAQLGRPALLNVPGVAIRLGLGERTASELVLASQRVVPERLFATGFAYSHPDIASAITAAIGEAAARGPGSETDATKEATAAP